MEIGWNWCHEKDNNTIEYSYEFTICQANHHPDTKNHNCMDAWIWINICLECWGEGCWHSGRVFRCRLCRVDKHCSGRSPGSRKKGHPSHGLSTEPDRDGSSPTPRPKAMATTQIQNMLHKLHQDELLQMAATTRPPFRQQAGWAGTRRMSGPSARQSSSYNSGDCKEAHRRLCQRFCSNYSSGLILRTSIFFQKHTRNFQKPYT